LLGERARKKKGEFFFSSGKAKEKSDDRTTDSHRKNIEISSPTTMPHASARPLALAWQLRTVFHSRSTLVASSSQQWLSTSASSAAEASAASKDTAGKKKPSTSKEQHDPKQKKKNEPQKPESKEEIGGPRGPEPTRYNDWEKNGRVSDF